MHSKTRRMFIELLEDDREWAQNVFSAPHVVGDAARRGGVPLPPFADNFVANFIAKEQTSDLGKAIEVLQNPNIECLTPEFKNYLVTILKNDTDWYLKTSKTGYSEFLITHQELCDRINEGLAEIRAMPTCQT